MVSKREGDRPDVWTHIAARRDKEEEGVEGAGQVGAEEAKDGHEEGSVKVEQAAGKEKEKEQELPFATSMLVVGSKGAGKSTLVSNFLSTSSKGSEEKPKPTVALDFTFGRRTNSSGDKKTLCQIWELGGGEKLERLIPVVLTKDRETNMVVAVVVDLSAPESAFDEAAKWLKLVRKYSSKVPIVLFGAKHDTFQNQDGLKRKALCQALRYIACINNAGLIFVSKKDKTTLNYTRAVLGHYAFHSEKKRSFYVDPNKLIVVAPGRDRLEKIGHPPGMTPDTPTPKLVRAWKDILQDYFPAAESPSRHGEDNAESKGPVSSDDPASDDSERPIELLPEPGVDAKRREKDTQLEQYRAQVLRNQRLGR